MTLVKYEPYNLLSQFQDEISRLFDARENPARDWVPAVDIRETAKEYIVHADVPGVDPEKIEITLEGGVLTIQGERQWESKDAEKEYRRVERARGRFYRKFNLPDTVNEDKVSAKNKNGVLEVTIPKQERVLPRKIAIKIG